MTHVEIYSAEGAIVLRAKGSELLILPQYITHLQTVKDPKAFVDYFTSEALVNRPARKLFQAWAKKDASLWNRIYSTVHAKEKS